MLSRLTAQSAGKSPPVRDRYPRINVENSMAMDLGTDTPMVDFHCLEVDESIKCIIL